MKKKMIAMFIAVVLVVSNASMTFALSPVAEVYYNVGNSTYDSSNFETELNAAIHAKLTAAGVNTKYVSIMDASANIAAVNDDKYVHKGYESWYMGTKPEVETADYNHVQTSNNGKTLTFYGYTVPGYKDYMLTTGSPVGKKILTFVMDESKVNYHSMEGGGFLFNSVIDGEGKLSGYAILFVSGAVNVYKIDKVDATAFHNETSRGLSNWDGTTMPGVTLVGTYSKQPTTHHSIKIVATDNSLNMWDNGVHSIQNLVLHNDVDDVFGNEFGPLVSHIGHGCEIISMFTFDNMKLYTTSEKSLDVAVNDIVWEDTAPLRHVINIDDVLTGYLDGGPIETNVKNALNGQSTQYIGITSPENKDTSETFINGINKGGLILDSTTTTKEAIIDQIATRVADQVINGFKDAITAIEAAETKTAIKLSGTDIPTLVKNNIELIQDEGVTTVWSSSQPSIVALDGTVTRPVTSQSGTYVTLTATITKDGLTSEKTFTVYVAAADPAPLSTLTAVEGNQQITLNFPALIGSSSVIVEQSTDGITFTPATTVEVLDGTSTSATVTGLTNDKEYYFRLNVVGGYYAGPSNEVTIKPKAPYVPVVEQPTMNIPVIVSDQGAGGVVVQDKITKLIGENLKVSAKLQTASGQDLGYSNIVMNNDGSFTLPKVAAGEYKLALIVIAPNGDRLAGPTGKLIVDGNGKATLSVDLIDPYGTILDSVTGEPVADVEMKLYWADTELNRSKGRTPGTLVNLPELPDFKPNKNHNSQFTTDSGEYGWMVYADGDYYFTGEKDGYIVFDSRNDDHQETFGVDSYIKNGVIHVGETIVKFSFSLDPKVKAAGNHSPYMLGYPDGAFRPEQGIVRAEVATILSRLYTSSDNSNKVAYSDVSESNWAAEAISIASNNEWMIGTGSNKFEPKKQISRAEFAQILMNLYDWDVVSESTYSDVNGHWAEQAIATAEKQGVLLDFTGENFNPNQSITRVEVVRIFNHLLERQPWKIKVEPKWTDVLESDSYYKDIMEASIPHPFEQLETKMENWK